MPRQRFAALLGVADAVVLDAWHRTARRNGAAFDWQAMRRDLDASAAAALVLAGGLDAENVARGDRALAPDVVDVSSGVESAPGIKDHARMRAFATPCAPRERRDDDDAHAGRRRDRFGAFGGRYVPETLDSGARRARAAYDEAMRRSRVPGELDDMLANYVVVRRR